jgi:undecaprenyl-diphosphatase
MSPVEAILLGALQGLTEFLPVSSSGHLVIVPALLGWRSNLSFDVLVHGATALAVLLYFRADWANMLGGALRGTRQGAAWRDPAGRQLCLILLATLPAAFAGLLLEPHMETLLGQEPVAAARIAAALLPITGLILLLAEWAAKDRAAAEQLGPKASLQVGFAQALAILPGISRSGSTIAAGLALGLSREAAARFSFLLATPIILGATSLKLFDLYSQGLAPGEGRALLLGFGSAFVVGYFSIGWLLNWLRRASLKPFAIYCMAFGGLALWLLR